MSEQQQHERRLTGAAAEWGGWICAFRSQPFHASGSCRVVLLFAYLLAVLWCC